MKKIHRELETQTLGYLMVLKMIINLSLSLYVIIASYNLYAGKILHR